MALTKINLANFVTGTLADGNIPDNITIDVASASPANALTGNTLASGVTASSLTSVGTLTGLTTGAITQNAGTLTIKNASSDSNGLKILQDSSDASKIYNHYNGTLELGVSSTTTLTINSSGVGIGGSPIDLLDLRTDPGGTGQPGVATTGADANNAIRITSTGNAINEKVGIAFGGYTGYVHGGIYGVGTGQSNNTIGDITFDLRASDSDTTFTERLRITSDGEIQYRTTGDDHYSSQVEYVGNDDIKLHFGPNYSFESGFRKVLTLDNQKVGIGTDDPGYLTELRVNDTTVDTPRFVIRQLGTGDASLGFQVPDSPNGWVMGCDTSSDECFVLGTGVGNLASAKKFQVNTTGFVTINDNDSGSAGSALKQLSLGDSSSTQFDRTNVGTITGLLVSNSYGNSGGSSNPTQVNTATGITFTHHSSSSGISYIASVAGSQNGDRSALHFGTRGSSGVKERFMLNDNGEVKIGHGGDGYLYHYQTNNNSHIWLLYAHTDDSYRFNRNGSGSDEMRIESDGDVHILGSLTQNSDIRLKKNIKTIDNALSKVNQLRGVTYNWKVSAGKNTDTKEIGMIADEVEKIIPELVKTDSVKGSFDEDGLDDMKSLKYGNVVGLLVEAVKELSAKVSELEKN